VSDCAGVGCPRRVTFVSSVYRRRGWRPRPAGERADGVELVKAKKIVLLAVVALLVFYLITQPTQSADAVQTVLGWLQEGAEAIITFVKSLFA
jgi:hypothetical protein